VLAHNCWFEGQSGYGMANNSGALRVDARYCWWGQASGPANPDNPGGQGTAVSGAVDFKPWIGGDPQAWTNWRLSFFTPEQLADPAMTDPAADPDHDGLNNWQEYVAGTNPTNAVSTFVLEIAADTAATDTLTNMVLSWPTVSGKTYRVYRSAGLETGAVFDPVAGPLAETGAPISVTNSLSFTGSRFFYRLSVE
jgi:hypothetical protein